MTDQHDIVIESSGPTLSNGTTSVRIEVPTSPDGKSSAEANPVRPADRPASQITMWLHRADQLLLGVLLIALVVLLLIFRWKLSGGWKSEIEIVSQQPREYFYSIDINKASWVEWAQLDGIGEKMAKRIVEDRDAHGPFKTIEQLDRVRGVGPKLIEKLRPFLKCDVNPPATKRGKNSSAKSPR